MKFLAYVTLRVLMGFLKNFGQLFGQAVWPAIANIQIYIYI